MKLWKAALRRLRRLARRSQFDQEIDDEIRFHLETRADELEAAGAPRAEAQQRARREFGSTMRRTEETRSAWQFQWLEDLLSDLRYAARALGRSPGFAATAIASLGLGIGANTTIFSLTMEMLLSESSCRDPGALVKIWIGGSSASLMRDYRFIRDAEIFPGLAGENEETQ